MKSPRRLAFSVFYRCAVLMAMTGGAVSASEPELFENNVPIVLTPTRLRQSLADVPGSVTVISAEMLKRLGITSVAEALRLVPGMAVTQVTGNDYRINYHGTNMLVPRRMNVLIDGMSVYRPAFARVDWKELPVVIEDIERIEVTRGPNSASYGANSMLAIVNIITKHPRDTRGTTLDGRVGMQNTAEGLARYGGQWGATTYRLTLARQQDGGFDFTSTMGAGHDSTRLNRVNFRSVTEIGAAETFDFEASAVQGVKEVEFIDRGQQNFPDVRLHDYYVNARWRRSLSPGHDLQVQAYVTHHDVEQPWRSCLPTAVFLPQLFDLWRSNPRYVNTLLAGGIPSGGTSRDDALAAAALATFQSLGARAALPTCADANQDLIERRYDLELQDTLVLSDSLRMVSGLGVRRDIGDSETYLAGRVTNNNWRVFANVEYKPARWLNVNAGGFFEKEKLSGSAFSPRIALNAHLSGNHTLRAVASRAVRMPDLLEQRAFWRYRSTNFTPPINGATEGFFYANARSPGNVNPEKITSREIGYFGNFPKHGLLLDVKLFDDRLTDLISEKLQVFDFAPTNNNWARLRGSELQATYEPNDRWMAYLAYAYLDNEASTLFEQTQYAKHSGAIAVSHRLANGWRGTFAYYGYGAGGAGQTYYGREDLTLSKTYRLGKDITLTPSFTIQHFDNRTSRYLRDFGDTRESRYDDSMHYYFSVRVTF